MTKQTLHKLIDVILAQKDFQKRLGNSIPDYSGIVEFEHVQTAISHNVYQVIEFQEFQESETVEEKKEELIDYLLFLINKYLYLGLNIVLDATIEESLCSPDDMSMSSAMVESLASMEQNYFIQLLRRHCIFKPWRVRTSESCTDKDKVRKYFMRSLYCFREIANATYDSVEDFIEHLEKKLTINIDRQNNKY